MSAIEVSLTKHSQSGRGVITVSTRRKLEVVAEVVFDGRGTPYLHLLEGDELMGHEIAAAIVTLLVRAATKPSLPFFKEVVEA